MNLIDELKVEDYSVVQDIRGAYGTIFDRMKDPAAITINIHPTVRILNSEKRNVKKSVGLTEVNSLWGTLSFEIRKMNFLSSQRNRINEDILAFANLDIGGVSGQLHIHGVVDNYHQLPEAPFHYLLRSALKTTEARHRIISGVPDIKRHASAAWVGYCFKNKYLHPLMTK